MATITAADYLVALASWFGLTLLAVGVAVLLLRPSLDQPEPQQVETDSPEAAKTVELPARRPGLRTAPTIHAPQYRRSDDDTVVIKPAETRR
ncbi:hypothetical protein [Micromonospora sp. NPDC005174]|uniref:hypothetical protein n=1 Tax=Micromonospora sp. NPDC005174 TaxID=3157018 RepID=UPI0033BA2DF3